MKIVEYLKTYDILNNFKVLPAENKHPICGKGWQSKYATSIDEFKYVNQLSFMELFFSDDYVVFDIDTKDKNGFNYEDRHTILNILKKLPKSIYKETSVSGQGFHIICKMNSNQRSRIQEMFPKIRKQEIAYCFEVFYSRKNIIVYPSKQDDNECKLIGNSKSLLDMKNGISDDDFDVLVDAIRKICDICNNKMPDDIQEHNVKTINNKRYFTPVYNEELYGMIEENNKHPYVVMINKYIANLNPEEKKEFLQILLDELGLEYEEKYGHFNIYSLISDDGLNPDSYIYIPNGKKSTYIYYDFHYYNAWNLISILYTVMKDDFIDVFIDITGFDVRKEIKDIPIIKVKTQEELKDAILKCIDRYGKIMVIAPTGFGKTSTIKEISKMKKMIMFEPLQIQVAQEYENCKDNFGFVYENIKKYNHGNDLIFATYDQYDKLIDYYNDRIIVVDECHCLCSDVYRNRTILPLYESIKDKKVIYMTATDHFVFLPDIDVKIVVDMKQIDDLKDNKFFTVDNRKGNILDKIISNMLNIRSNHWVYIDSKEKLKMIKEKLIENGVPPRKIKVITSDNPEEVASIVRNMELRKMYVLSTRKLGYGFHLFDEIPYVIHSVVNDINVEIQLINRFRMDNKVFNIIYTSEKQKLDKEWLYDYLEKEASEIFHHLLNYIQNTDWKITNTKYTPDFYMKYSKNPLYASQFIYNEYINKSRNLNIIVEVLKRHQWKQVSFDKLKEKVGDIFEFVYEKKEDVLDDLMLQKFEYYLNNARCGLFRYDWLIENKLVDEKDDEGKICKIVNYIYKKDLFDGIDIDWIKEMIKKKRYDIIWKQLIAIEERKLIESRDENILMELNILREELNKLRRSKISVSDMDKIRKKLGLKKNVFQMMLGKLGWVKKDVRNKGKKCKMFVKSK